MTYQVALQVHVYLNDRASITQVQQYCVSELTDIKK